MVLGSPYKMSVWISVLLESAAFITKVVWFSGDRCYGIKSVFPLILKFTSTYYSQKKNFRNIILKMPAMVHIFIHSLCIDCLNVPNFC